MRLRLTLGTVGLLAMIAGTAHADPGVGSRGRMPGLAGADWGRLLVDVDTVARNGADVLDAPRCAAAGCLTEMNATAARPERAGAVTVQNTTNSWFNLAPTVSLVARDWASAYRVTGDRLALVDALRLTSSTRMVLTRVRLSEGSRITPYAQVGLGQWRTDPYLLPLTPRYEEMAAQVAGGFEVRVRGSWHVALESSMTMVYIEQRDSTLPSSQLWSTTVASRIEF